MIPSVAEVLRKGEHPNNIPVTIKIETNLTDDELMLAHVMCTTGSKAVVDREFFSGGIWIRICNLMFSDMTAPKARLYILEQGFHPEVITDEIKSKIGITDETMVRANFLRHIKGATGHAFWKNFHLGYLLKGMSADEMMRFLIENEYTVKDVPNIVFRTYPIQREKLEYAYSLRRNKMETETILGILKV